MLSFRCPVVERIILDAYSDKPFFHVCVLDSPIEHKGFFNLFFTLNHFVENHIIHLIKKICSLRSCLFPGKQLVKTLCARNIRCSYGMLSSVGYLMKEVSCFSIYKFKY